MPEEAEECVKGSGDAYLRGGLCKVDVEKIRGQHEVFAVTATPSQ